MGILKIVIGFSALFLAWGLLFRTGLIFRLNAWIKDNVLNDQIVLYSRRRLAFLLFILRLVALFSGVENVFWNSGLSTESKTALINKIQLDFKSHHYAQVISSCRMILKSDPKNIPIRENLINALWAMGSRDVAAREAQLLIHFNPSNTTAQLILSKEKIEKSGKK